MTVKISVLINAETRQPSLGDRLAAWRRTHEENANLPRDIRRVINRESRIVLVVSHLKVLFEAVSFGISDICAVQE